MSAAAQPSMAGGRRLLFEASVTELHSASATAGTDRQWRSERGPV
jgi:hypothetical protein